MRAFFTRHRLLPSSLTYYINPSPPPLPLFRLSPSPSPPASASPLRLRPPSPSRAAPQICVLRLPIRAPQPPISALRGMAVAAAAAAADDSSPAKRLWLRTKGDTVFAAFSPFVVCLAAGNLDLEVFRSYISQDALFLRAFANAYMVAEDCADDDESKAAIATTRKSIFRRLNERNPVLEEWGVDFTKEITPNPATVKYVNFLQETAAGKVGGKAATKIVTPFEKTKIGAYTAGVVTPCLRLYAFLVKEIQMLLDPVASNHPYKKWIDGHSYASFEASALQMEDLLEKLSVTLTGDELETINKLYKQAMKLEIEFFHAQYVTQPTVVPLIRSYSPEQQRFVLFSDFDLTCSIVDSSAILAEIAILTVAKADLNNCDEPVVRRSSAELRSSWHDLSSQYTEDYEQCIEKILMIEQDKGFDHEALCQALELLCLFEKEANSRVIESGLLKGLNIDDIKKTGEFMKLQDGCLEFLQLVSRKEELSGNVHVLSSCWCADLIRGVFTKGGLGAVSLHANEFAYEGSISTGEIVQKMESPLDKLHKFRDILKSYSGNEKTFSIYIGDSVGDLLCLLEADVGIVVGQSESLRRVGMHFGVSFVPLFHGVVRKQEQLAEGTPPWQGLSGILYTVSSWAEIHAFILGA